MITGKKADIPPVGSREQRSLASVIVVLGAAVWPNGIPSKAMKRRIEGALSNDMNGTARFLVSGGLGKNPPTEAEVMRNLLIAAGIPEARILMDPSSKDTLASIRNCAHIIAGLPVARVLVCSDVYHIPRCRLLFRLLGVKTESAKVASGRAANGLLRWLFLYVREAAAIPWDTALLLASYYTH